MKFNKGILENLYHNYALIFLNLYKNGEIDNYYEWRE